MGRIPLRSKYPSNGKSVQESRNLPLNFGNLKPARGIDFNELTTNLGSTNGSKAAKVLIDSQHSSYVVREKFHDLLWGKKPRTSSKPEESARR